MEHELIVENEFSYIESGEGRPIVILHGLMGKLSNFKGVYEYFPKKNYKVVIPELPVKKISILNTNVKTFAKYVFDFVGSDSDAGVTDFDTGFAVFLVI